MPHDKILLVENFWRQWNLGHITVTKTLNCSRQRDVGNEEKDLR